MATRLRFATALALPLLTGMAALDQSAGAAPPPRIDYGAFDAAPAGPSPDTAADAPAAPVQSALTPETRDKLYPFYMPMGGLHKPAIRLFVKCDASREAGHEVYAGRSGDSLYGRAEGGYEFIYEALDGAGKPCVYPFAPWMPQITGSLDGTQYILRSSIPGKPVTFRTPDEWASIDLRMFGVGNQRIHFEMRDIDLDFPAAIQPMGALHLEVVDMTRPGLFTAVIRRSRIFGGKNALFVPRGQTMLYVEDSDITGNVGTNSDQQHSTYINGILVSHMRNSSWHGQKGWSNVASGHQLKDKAYLRIYENVSVSNRPGIGTPSAMPLIDASGYGFTWSEGLRIERIEPQQAPRDALVDLRAESVYGDLGNYPWPLLADRSWTMPADPLAVLDKVYLSVFLDTQVRSFRTEPHVFALRQQGTSFEPGTTVVDGADSTTRAQQRMVSLAFGTSGTFTNVYAPGGWTYVDPQLPANARWVMDRDAFIRHALGLIGR